MRKRLAILNVVALCLLSSCVAPVPDGSEKDACNVANHGVVRLAGLKPGEYLEREERDLKAALENRESAVVDREPGTIVVTFKSDVLFEMELTSLKEAGEQELHLVAKVFNCYADSHLNVCCHTDSIGSEQANLELSQSRATAVKEALTRNGVAPDRISTEGHGENQPIASNASEAGRQLNRRITIEILPGRV